MAWLRGRLNRGRRGREVDRVPERVAALSRFVDRVGPHLPSSTVEPAQALVRRAGGRLALSRDWFADLSATGGLSFLREEDAIEGLPGATGALALGARF